MNSLRNNAIYGVAFVLGILLLCQSTIAYNQKVEVKRMDIATCLVKFDVKNDMIIRTDESRKLGALFLDSVDIGSRVECLHLCCETDACDVFVFEEKGQGSCFLFHCGPAQDFRCKFTKHANYTSAIYSMEKKVTRPAATTTKTIQTPPVTLSLNEMELNNLKPKLAGGVNGKLIGPTTPLTTTPKVAVAAATKNKTSACSRFQFQCHSGDCIAVYNACDGIPQCDDGSDEGPECQSVTRAPENLSNKSSAVGRVQLMMSDTQSNPNAFIGRNREDPLTAPQWPNSVQTQNDNGLNKFVNGLRMPDNIMTQISPDQMRQILPAQDSQQQQQQLSMNAINAAKDGYKSWDSIADINWPQQMPQFPMKPLDTFQTKQTQYSHFQPDLVQPDLTASQTQIKKQQLSNWPILEPNLPNVPNVAEANFPHNHINEEVLPEKTSADVIKDVPVGDRKKDGKNTYAQTKSDSTSSDDSDYGEEEEETTTEPPKKKKKHRKVNKVEKKPEDIENTKKEENLISHQMKAIHSGLQAEFMDHDGKADRPGGAVVSLAFGILITICLVMVISCRTTAVRKRIRRGGKGYAHDADFLVNGMYL